MLFVKFPLAISSILYATKKFYSNLLTNKSVEQMYYIFDNNGTIIPFSPHKLIPGTPPSEF